MAQFMSPRVQFMFPQNSLCSQSTVYVSRVQFMSQEYTLCPKVQFMSPEYSIIPHRTVYVPTEQFMFPEYSLCPRNTVHFP